MFKRNGLLARRATGLAVVAIGAAMLVQAPAGAEPTPVGLGTATSFAVLAGAGITNTGATGITGDAGTYPTPAETGFNGPPPDQVTFFGAGVDHAGDAVTQGAKADLLIAFDDAAGRLPEIAHAVELGGDNLTPGVYSNGTFGLTGVLTLDFQNDLTASFIFKTATTLITAVGSSIVLVNADPAAACRITWKVGSSATFGTGTQFIGDVLVKDDITATTGATFIGRLLARDGAVTLDTNTIDRGGCATLAAAPTTTTTATGVGGIGSQVAPTSTTTSSTSTTSTTTTSTTSTTATTAPPTVIPDDGASPGSPPVDDASSTGAPVPAGPSGPSGPVPSPPGSGTPSVPQLPLTGTETGPLAILGVALVAAGTLALLSGRRVRPR